MSHGPAVAAAAIVAAAGVQTVKIPKTPRPLRQEARWSLQRREMRPAETPVPKQPGGSLTRPTHARPDMGPTADRETIKTTSTIEQKPRPPSRAMNLKRVKALTPQVPRRLITTPAHGGPKKRPSADRMTNTAAAASATRCRADFSVRVRRSRVMNLTSAGASTPAALRHPETNPAHGGPRMRPQMEKATKATAVASASAHFPNECSTASG